MNVKIPKIYKSIFGHEPENLKIGADHIRLFKSYETDLGSLNLMIARTGVEKYIKYVAVAKQFMADKRLINQTLIVRVWYKTLDAYIAWDGLYSKYEIRMMDGTLFLNYATSDEKAILSAIKKDNRYITESANTYYAIKDSYVILSKNPAKRRR